MGMVKSIYLSIYLSIYSLILKPQTVKVTSLFLSLQMEESTLLDCCFDSPTSVIV